MIRNGKEMLKALMFYFYFFSPKENGMPILGGKAGDRREVVTL